jgi:hypothetical protein
LGLVENGSVSPAMAASLEQILSRLQAVETKQQNITSRLNNPPQGGNY